MGKDRERKPRVFRVEDLSNLSRRQLSGKPDYITDKTKLAQVLRILLPYRNQCIEFYRTQKLGGWEDHAGNELGLLAFIFEIANSERQFASEDQRQLGIHEFRTGSPEKLREIRDKGFASQSSHGEYLGWLCGNISGMNQKTANLFLKWLVMFGKDFGLSDPWAAWEPHLHIPLDIWVIRLLNGLGACSSAFQSDFYEKLRMVPQFRGADSKYGLLQEELREVGQLAQLPAIYLDELWMMAQSCCKQGGEKCWISPLCPYPACSS